MKPRHFRFLLSPQRSVSPILPNRRRTQWLHFFLSAALTESRINYGCRKSTFPRTWERVIMHIVIDDGVRANQNPRDAIANENKMGAIGFLFTRHRSNNGAHFPHWIFELSRGCTKRRLKRRICQRPEYRSRMYTWQICGITLSKCTDPLDQFPKPSTWSRYIFKATSVREEDAFFRPIHKLLLT